MQRKTPTEQIQVQIKDTFRLETQLTYDTVEKKFEKKPVQSLLNLYNIE